MNRYSTPASSLPCIMRSLTRPGSKPLVEQVQFRFPDFPARFDGELIDVELRSDIKYFDGRSLYALAGGCSSLWANPSRYMLDKIVTWMTTAGLEVPQHRHRSRSYASPEDMSTDGYLI
ncbi:hypothetical protein FOZ62_012237 [Perkinsus olseni]|uniref:Uncharacterized protein n=1 Tax=Perkinsus olseni TaxID=32597 RepID=A0A7J6TAK8_PEROL|nr:hypothetical protein FOZ62_012237 [Perkinsus olseni]